jgi:hypothetical protein
MKEHAHGGAAGTSKKSSHIVWHVSPYGLRFVNRIGGPFVSFELQPAAVVMAPRRYSRQVKRQRLGFRLSDAAPIKMSAKKY